MLVGDDSTPAEAPVMGRAEHETIGLDGASCAHRGARGLIEVGASRVEPPGRNAPPSRAQ